MRPRQRLVVDAHVRSPAASPDDEARALPPLDAALEADVYEVFGWGLGGWGVGWDEGVDGLGERLGVDGGDVGDGFCGGEFQRCDQVVWPARVPELAEGEVRRELELSHFLR